MQENRFAKYTELILSRNIMGGFILAGHHYFTSTNVGHPLGSHAIMKKNATTLCRRT